MISIHYPLKLLLASTTTVSFVIAILVVLTSRWHSTITSDYSSGIQKVHQGQTPRIGGLGIVCGFLVAGIIMLTQPASEGKTLTWNMLVAASPALIFGLAEDITKRVSTRNRLLATMFSGVVAWYLTGYALTQVDLPVVDGILALTPVAVIFTAFAVGGVANAINIIDGFNGLASGTVLICLAAMGIMASQVEDADIVLLTLILSAATFGFFLVNFPYGRLFLGDGGAYMLGFMIAWIAVMLSMRHPGVITPWAPLLACAYPILEAVFSMGRRFIRRKAVDQPDRTHLHSLVYRRIVPCLVSTKNKTLRNAAVSPILWLFAAIPATLSVLLKSSTVGCILAFIFTALLYCVFYARISQFHWAYPKLTLIRRPVRNN